MSKPLRFGRLGHVAVGVATLTAVSLWGPIAL